MMTRIGIGTPEEYRQEEIGQESVDHYRQLSHEKLEHLQGKIIPVTLKNETTLEDIKKLFKEEIEFSFALVFSPYQEAMQSLGLKKEEIIVDQGDDDVCFLHGPITMGSKTLTIPMDKHWRYGSDNLNEQLSIICHTHPSGNNGFSGADMEIIERSSDLIHGVVTSSDLNEFKVTTFDPLTKEIKKMILVLDLLLDILKEKATFRL